jgi:hypothetical protein
MKKALMALILFASLVGMYSFAAFAEEAETGNLVIHFQKWDGDYTDVGLFTWTTPMATKAEVDGTDEFGVYFEFLDVPTDVNPAFIIYYQAEGAEWWANKLTENVEPGAILEAGKTVHVYVFEGGNTKSAGQSNYFVADPDAYNALVVYYDPAGAYEEELGVHAWGWVGYGSEWGNPSQIFETAGKAPSGYDVKAGMLQADVDPDSGLPYDSAGFLVYLGSDATKKTGDLKPETGYFEEKIVGTTEVVYIINAGDGVTSNNNVFTDPAEFALEAFSFRLNSFNNEDKSGTYAVNPSTIIAITSAPIASPYPNAEDKEAARATIEGWFTVVEVISEGVYGEPLEIERVDFATTNTTLNQFVVILAEGSHLDNEKEYKMLFNLGLEVGNLEAEIMLDLDVEAPVLTFISPTGIVGKPAEERIINVPWGQPFNQNLFPRFRVEDGRDGDLTPFVFVPKGEYSVLDTRTEGDYTIMLRVEDRWGNVTEETFIFRVVKN